MTSKASFFSNSIPVKCKGGSHVIHAEYLNRVRYSGYSTNKSPGKGLAKTNFMKSHYHLMSTHINHINDCQKPMLIYSPRY